MSTPDNDYSFQKFLLWTRIAIWTTIIIELIIFNIIISLWINGIIKINWVN